uniref:Uncharacterized protein n=1 Tax=Arundo donax TaxID=35708 RepID=A0A0A9GIQ4_ARUDO
MLPCPWTQACSLRCRSHCPRLKCSLNLRNPLMAHLSQGLMDYFRQVPCESWCCRRISKCMPGYTLQRAFLQGYR